MRSSIFIIFLISMTMVSVNADVGNQTSIMKNDENQLVMYTGILAIGTIAIGIATIVTLIKTIQTHEKQIQTVDKQNKITALMEVFKTLSDEEHRDARRVTYTAKRAYDRAKNIKAFDVYYKEVGITASHFNQIGELVKKGTIPKEEFLDLYADTTILCWKALKEYIENQQEKRKSKFYMNQFVWLGEQAEIYWKMNRPEDPLPEIF
jgi:hypothetical protein